MNKLAFSIFVLLAAVGMFSICKADKSMTLTELDNYHAACDECCDVTGGSDCSGSGTSSCSSYSNGKCITSTHTWAPSGDDDAECEGAWYVPGTQTCSYTANVYCSNYRECSCTTVYLGMIIGIDYWDCDEGSSVQLSRQNMSRKMCAGNACWI